MSIAMEAPTTNPHVNENTVNCCTLPLSFNGTFSDNGAKQNADVPTNPLLIANKKLNTTANGHGNINGFTHKINNGINANLSTDTNNNPL